MRNVRRLIPLILGSAISIPIYCMQNALAHKDAPRPNFPRLFPKPTGQNGYEEFVQAVDLANASTVWQEYENAPDEQGGPTLAMKRRVLADPTVQCVLATLRTGLKKHIRPPQEPVEIQTLFPELKSFRSVARLLCMEMDVLFADGQTSKATDCLNEGLEFGRGVEVGTLISGVVGLYIQNITLQAFSPHLNQLTPRDCETLIRITTNHLNLPDPQIALVASERDMYVRSFRKYRADAGALLDQIGPGPNAEAAAQQDYADVRGLVRAHPDSGTMILDQAAEIVSAHYDRALSEIKRSSWERKYPGPIERVSPASRLIYSLCPPSYSRLSDRFASEHVMVQILALHAAVLRFGRRHGRLPASLEELKPGKRSVDPFTGRSLVYERLDGEAYRISSAGAYDLGDSRRPPTGKRVPITVECSLTFAQPPRHTSSSEDISPGPWTTCKPMNQGAVFAGTALGSDGRIYVVSGNTHYDGGLRAAMQVYDPKKDAWTEASPIPTPRTSAGIAAGPDGRIYVVGGADRESRKNVLEAYDPKTDTWARLKPMPTSRDAPQAVAARGADGRIRIYVIGGRDRSKAVVNLDTVEAYDPATDTWTTQAPMPTRRHAHVATLGPDGLIYVLGGTNMNVMSTNAVEVYHPIRNSWAKGAPMPHGLECAMATFTPGPRGEVLVFGGWDSHKRPVRDAWAYNPHTNHWRSLPPMSTARAAGGVVTIEGTDGCIHVYVIGGTGEDGSGAIHPPPGSVETGVEEYTFPRFSRGR
jgi:N-acetylneuraminic acid mutarotase